MQMVKTINKKLLIIILIIFTIFIASCKKEQKEQDKKPEITKEKEEVQNINSIMHSYILNKDVVINTPYQDSFFLNTNYGFSKELLNLSYSSAAANFDEISAANFYQSLNFNNIYISDSYSNDSVETAGYILGHKRIKDKDVVAVSFKGFYYSLEWSSNFNLGLDHDHLGFTTTINNIYDNILNYLNNYENDHLFIWITGYSRSGTLTYLLAKKLLDNNIINNNQLAAYSFESQRAVDINNIDKEYLGIYNIINKADILQGLVPEKYGFKRIGTNIYLDYTKTDELLDKEKKIASFNKIDKYQNEEEFIDYVIESLTTYDIEKNYTVKTRTEFQTRFSASLGYLISTVFDFSSYVFNKIIYDFKQLNSNQIFKLLSDDNLYQFFKTYLELDKKIYDEEMVKKHCKTVANFFSKPASKLLFASVANPNTILRSFQMHYPDVNYVLLQDYLKK